jgi:hypothetical protein
MQTVTVRATNSSKVDVRIQRLVTMMLKLQRKMAHANTLMNVEFAAVTALLKALVIAMVLCLPTVMIALAFA